METLGVLVALFSLISVLMMVIDLIKPIFLPKVWGEDISRLKALGIWSVLIPSLFILGGILIPTSSDKNHTASKKQKSQVTKTKRDKDIKKKPVKKSLPPYEIVSIDTYHYGINNSIKRFGYNVHVKEPTGVEQLKKIARAVVKKTKKENPFNSMEVVFRKWANTNSSRRNKAIYASGGDVDKAKNISTGNYSSMEFDFSHLDPIEEKNKGERFGYSLEERQKIYKEIIRAEDKARIKADEKYPPGENIDKNTEYMRNLMDVYKEKLASKYDLTKEQLRKIGTEGSSNNWPIPESPNS